METKEEHKENQASEQTEDLQTAEANESAEDLQAAEASESAEDQQVSDSDEETADVTKKKRIYQALLGVCVLGLVITLSSFLVTKYQEKQAQKRFEELARRAQSTELPEAKEPTYLSVAEKIRILEEKYGIVVPDKHLDFDVLHEENEHIYAWVYIPNTRIDYPILQHPTDETYYLEHNLDGSKGFPGCIYTELYNTTTFLDRMTVIYGHNMRNQTMFTDLHKYKEEEFFNEHPNIFIYTEDDIFVYRIFSASRADDEHILLSQPLYDDNVFWAYLAKATDLKTLKGNANTDIPLSIESRVVALATCVSASPQERFVVQGALIEEEGFYPPSMY